MISASVRVILLLVIITLATSTSVPSSLLRGPDASPVVPAKDQGASEKHIVVGNTSNSNTKTFPEGTIKATAHIDEQQKDANETAIELRKAGSTGPVDATVLHKAATAHQARLSQRAREERENAEKARNAAIEERTEREKAGVVSTKFDPRKDKVNHVIANQVPDIETCGLRHCKDADYQMHLKYTRQPVDNFLQKCKKIYEEWKATVGYAHDCLDVNSTSIKESREPFPGFNNLKNAYEERLKQIAAHKMERLNIFAKHSADDGAHHHKITTANLNETKDEEKRQQWIDKTGELKIRRKQMSDRIKYNTEGKDIKKRKIGFVYEDGRKFEVPKPRKKVVEDPPEEGWGPGYSIAMPNPSRL
jgi:hypothetical protein